MDEFRLVGELGIPVAEGGVAKDADEAVRIAEGIGYPVVLKIMSRDILHKTEAKAVLLNLNSAGEVRSSFKRIMENARNYNTEARIEGVLVQKFYGEGTEVIVGLMRDDVFGYAVMFGLGGIFTEVLGDITYRIAPIDEDEAMEMIMEIDGYPVLSGTRGSNPRDTASLAKAISAFSRLGETLKVKEAEINPLLVFDEGIVAVDVRILV
jgi:acyl-CoA synthetase (NDP forming)